MKSLAVPPRTAGARLAGYRPVLWLLPVVVLSIPPSAAPAADPNRLSRPYLATVGPPPLRFADVIPPPDLSVRPPVGSPPLPAGDAAAAPAELPLVPLLETASVNGAAVSANAPFTAPAPADPVPPPAAPRTPAPILQDDARPRVKAEDFLPYFLFPQEGARPGVVVPGTAPAAATPAAAPPSSATYRVQ